MLILAHFDVRPALVDECGPLAALWCAGWHEAHAAIVPASLGKHRTIESFTERLASALDATRVIGPVGEPLGFSITAGDELYQLFVSPEARGTGVAAALIADVETNLAAHGVKTAWLACAIGNTRAAMFYEKRGWRRVGTISYPTVTPDGMYSLDTWRYEKRLTKRPPPAAYSSPS